MFDLERWQEIFETLRKNKLRTFLTGLSVASGIFILVILLGFSKGIENGVKSEFEQDATNKISVWSSQSVGQQNQKRRGPNPDHCPLIWVEHSPTPNFSLSGENRELD